MSAREPMAKGSTTIESVTSTAGFLFHKRTLSLWGLLVALARLLVRLPRVVAIHIRSDRLRPPFREALWLAVTEVNGCRFCAYVHEGMAGSSGLSPADIELLLSAADPGALAALDEREAAVVAYAKVWAESGGVPPAGAKAQVVDASTARELADLHSLLVVIDFSNRAGNTVDSLLHRFTHPRRLLQPWGLLNDLVVGFLVALFGWPALLVGAFLRWRVRRHLPRSSE